MEHRTASDLERAPFPETFRGFLRNGADVMLGWGDTVPVNGSSGYGKACLWLHTDGGTDDTILYCNNGTSASSTFAAMAAV